MYKKIPITDVFAREILDSRGNPTLEVEVLAGEKTVGRAQVPAGASKGFYEAIELRDGELRYHGLGVERAVNHVNDQIAREIIGMDVFDQCAIDHVLQKLDGTKDKSHLGANAMLGVSLASAKAAAAVLEIPLYRYIGGINAKKLPIPMMNVINGGKHASNDLDMQEFMIMPIKFSSFKENLRVCVEIYHTLQKVLEQKGYQSSVGDEGGFAPNLTDTEEVLSLLVKAIGKAGYRAGEDVAIALDVAASELYNKEFKKYVFAGEGKKSGQSVIRSSEEMISYYQHLVHEYPIVSLEDPLDEDDWEGWKKLTETLGRRVQLVGDDLFVTNLQRFQKGLERQIGNAILIKLNQIGTLTEAMDVIELARKSGYNIIISHRSGETEDSLIADLSIAVNAGQIKAGAPCRGERISKYNQLLRIEEQSWI